MSDYFGSVEVKHRNWLDAAVKDHKATLALIESRRLPATLTGSFVVTMCLHFLRCVYGSDLESLHAIHEIVMAKEIEKVEQAELLRHVQHCRDTDCVKCEQYRNQQAALAADLGITPSDLAESDFRWEDKER